MAGDDKKTGEYASGKVAEASQNIIHGGEVSLLDESFLHDFWPASRGSNN